MLLKNKQKHSSPTFTSTALLHRAITVLLCACAFYFLLAEQRNLSLILSNTIAFQTTSESISLLPTNNEAAPRANRTSTMSIADAINTLRCFTTPQCYPRLLCASGGKPQKVQQILEFEEQSFCINDLFLTKTQDQTDLSVAVGDNSRHNAPCLVYSFGINNNINWEAKMAKLFHCEVFAFDPTSNLETNPAPNVTFYKLGLQGAREDEYSNSNGEYVADVAATHSEMYEAINSTLLKTLEEIQQIVGHEGRTIDVLKMDCEGCEYGVLKQLACRGGSQYVNQLMVEFHFQKNLGLANSNDVLLAADAIKCLEEERWGIVAMEQSGVGPYDAQLIDPVRKIIKDIYFAASYTLRRASRNETMPWDELLAAQEIRAVKNAFEKKQAELHGTIDSGLWPEEAQNEWRRIEDEGIYGVKMATLYEDMFSKFDKFERYPE